MFDWVLNTPLIYANGYLGSYQTYIVFSHKRLLVADNVSKKLPAQIFGKVLNRP